MYIGTLSMRYAKALLAFANESGVASTVYGEAMSLNNHWRTIDMLGDMVEIPVVKDADKLRVLVQASGRQPTEVMRKFLALVLKEKREKYLPYILHSFIYLYRKQEKIRVGKLITAVPMAEEEVNRIRKIVVDSAGGTAEFTTKVDPSIEGGFIFEINTYRLNASVADQMRRIKQQFIEKNRRIV